MDFQVPDNDVFIIPYFQSYTCEFGIVTKANNGKIGAVFNGDNP